MRRKRLATKSTEVFIHKYGAYFFFRQLMRKEMFWYLSVESILEDIEQAKEMDSFLYKRGHAPWWAGSNRKASEVWQRLELVDGKVVEKQ